MPNPNVGFPEPVIGSPSLPMIFAVSESPLKSTIEPVAVATPGRARISRTRLAGTVGVVDDQSSGLRAETTASVCS